jgi:hypothetical protein
MVPHGQGNLPSGHRRTTSTIATAKISTIDGRSCQETSVYRHGASSKSAESCHNFCPVTSMVIARTAATAMVVTKIVSKILSIMRAGPSDGTTTKHRQPEWIVGTRAV